MKWFRHDSDAHQDAKLEKLLIKYGSDGYGLYFYCLEIIAGELTPENITFELEHDAEILAYKLKIDTLRVEEIMRYCVELGLFQISQTTKRIMCLALAKRVDEYMSKNPEICKIQRKIKGFSSHKKSRQTPDKLPTNSGQSTTILHDIILHDTKLHDTKIHENVREEKRPSAHTPPADSSEPENNDDPMNMMMPYSEGNPYTKISANQFNSFIDKAQGFGIPGYGIKMMMDHYADWIQKQVLEHPKSRDYMNRSAYHNLIGWVMKSWWFEQGVKLPVPDGYKNKIFEKIKVEELVHES